MIRKVTQSIFGTAICLGGEAGCVWANGLVGGGTPTKGKMHSDLD